MDNMQENVETEPFASEEMPQKAKIFAGLIIALLAVVIIIAIVPGWRSAVLDTIFMNEQERLIQKANKLGDRIPEGEYPTEAELLGAAAELNTQPLTDDEANQVLEGLDAISR